MSEQQSTATEPIQNGTNGSLAGTLIKRERERLAYRSIIKECLKFNGKNAQDDKVEDKMPTKEHEEFRKAETEHSNLKATFLLKMKVYNDPIHGSIQLNPLEQAIVNTPEFYRLREIKQLGGKNHVFPGAVHTRLEHSIGVCHLAGRFVTHLRQRSCPSALVKRIPEGANYEQRKYYEDMQDEELGGQEDLCIRLAGLCHDLGHGPFSHLFDDVKETILSQSFKHEKVSVMIFKRILLQHVHILVMFMKCGLTGEHVKMIGKMIHSEETQENLQSVEKYLYEIVANDSSGLDVDKWDYFARDCHYLGLKNEFDFERCIALSSIVKDGDDYHVGFRNKEKSNIYGMFRTRCVLFQKAYNHKIADGIDMMIRDALVDSESIPMQLPQPDQWKKPEDVTLKKILQNMTQNDLTGYIFLTDSILSTFMLSRANTSEESMKLKQVQDIIRRISERDIYKSVCELSYYSDEYKSPKNMKFSGMNTKDWEVQNLKIKYASEKGEDPVQSDVYFFTKERRSMKIPVVMEKNTEGSRGDTDALPSKNVRMESKLNLPKAFTEYQIRLYCKTPKTMSDEVEKKVEEFTTYVEGEMKKLKKQKQKE